MDTNTSEVTATTSGLRVPWGLQPPADAIVAWGARAIYERVPSVQAGRKYAPGYYTFSTLPDRRGLVGGDETAQRALCAWLSKKGLPALTKLVKAGGPSPDERCEIRVEDGDYVIVANPNASYGYLYIGAWQKAPATQQALFRLEDVAPTPEDEEGNS